jgi:hypothetical protein
MQLKKCYRKGWQLFASHVEEASKDEVSMIGYHVVLKEFIPGGTWTTSEKRY